MPPSDWIRLWLKVPLHPGSEWQVAICTWPRDSGAMAVGEELPATKPPGVPGSVVAVLPTPASMSPAPPPDHPRFAPPCKAAPKAGSRPVTPRTEARAADGPLCLLQSPVLTGQRPTRHKAGARPEAPNSFLKLNSHHLPGKPSLIPQRPDPPPFLKFPSSFVLTLFPLYCKLPVFLTTSPTRP